MTKPSTSLPPPCPTFTDDHGAFAARRRQVGSDNLFCNRRGSAGAVLAVFDEHRDCDRGIVRRCEADEPHVGGGLDGLCGPGFARHAVAGHLAEARGAVGDDLDHVGVEQVVDLLDRLGQRRDLGPRSGVERLDEAVQADDGRPILERLDGLPDHPREVLVLAVVDGVVEGALVADQVVVDDENLLVLLAFGGEFPAELDIPDPLEPVDEFGNEEDIDDIEVF